MRPRRRCRGAGSLHDDGRRRRAHRLGDARRAALHGRGPLPLHQQAHEVAERAAARAPGGGRSRPRGTPPRRAARRAAPRAPPARAPARTPGPPRRAGPARPAIWTMRAKARSSERKPACWSGASASTTAATVTSGRSCPFATICVPSRIAAPGPANSSSSRADRPARATRSTRPSARAAPRARAAPAPARPPGPPCPAARSPRRRSAGTRRGTRSSRPQWWQTRRRGPSWCTRATSQSGQRAIHPHSRQSAMSEKPRRSRGRWPSRRAAAASCNAAARGARSVRSPGGACRRSPRAGSGEPSARRGRVSRGSACQVSGRGVALP